MTQKSPTNSEEHRAAQNSYAGAAVITERPQGQRAGDLARRVSHRRTELGLSTQELAKRAGIDAWFLAYFEQSTDSTLSGTPSSSSPTVAKRNESNSGSMGAKARRSGI